MNPELEAKLSRLFAAMEARKAAIRREREDQKLSRHRYWWQEPQTNETPCQENTLASSSPTP